MRIYLAFVLAVIACQKRSDAPPEPPATPPQPTAPAIRVTAPMLAGQSAVEGDFAIKDFAFTSGERLATLSIHYTTYGHLVRDAAGHAANAVLIMHGTTGSGMQFTRKQFADVLFGPGQLLDLTRYYVILPDDIGHGLSSKPSDGMHAKFPSYGYRDMIAAEHALVTSGLHVDHLRLVMGTSMGCMHTWMWLEAWPSMMDAAMPLACLPVAIAGRNRAWRKMIIDAIRHDPAWKQGDYAEQPRAALETVADIFAIASSAPIQDHKRMPTPDAADRETEEATRKFIDAHDANDLLYAVSASRDYDPSADLENITAPVMFVNSADDFINPPELAIAEREIRRVKRGKLVVIPASDQTHGHGTHTWAAVWQSYLAELLDGSKR